MAKTAVIAVRIDPELKRKAEQVFTELGLATSQAIVLFLKEESSGSGWVVAL